MTAIRRDPFDSDVLGKHCGIVDGLTPDVFVQKTQWDHVRSALDMSHPTWRSTSICYAEDGFRLASVRGAFEGTVLALGSYMTARGATDEEVKDIINLAPLLFAYSRFHTDPFYNQSEVYKLHERWITRLVNERCLYVVGPFGAPRGFVGFSRTTHDGDAMLDIELIAALDGLPGSGRHVLNSLVAFERCHRVRAKTQLANIPAVRLYHAMGMKLTKTESIYTWSRA